MLNLLALGRLFRARTQHRNFSELADELEQTAHALIERSRGRLRRRTYLEASERWEWQLGSDLLMLLRYAREHVPSDAAEQHGSRHEPASSPSDANARLARNPGGARGA